jgi:hypothetical protein
MTQPNVARYRKMVVAMKPEAAYATDVFTGAYLAADVIPCFNVVPKINLQEIPNLSMAGDLGRLPSIIGQETASVTFSMYLRGKGVAYAGGVKPEADLPLRGCGLSSVFSGGVGAEIVTFAPTNTLESMTIYVVQEIEGQANAPALKMTGCFGTVEFVKSAGNVVEMRFTFVGHMEGRVDIAYVAGTPAITPQYPTLKSAGFLYDAYAPRIGNIGFVLGNTVSPLPSVNAVGGVAGFYISDRNPRISIDPEGDRVAIYDWYTKWKNGNAASLAYTVGITQYNKAVFTFPKALAVDQSYAQRDGLTAFPTALLATIQAGLDDFSIVFS